MLGCQSRLARAPARNYLTSPCRTASSYWFECGDATRWIYLGPLVIPRGAPTGARRWFENARRRFRRANRNPDWTRGAADWRVLALDTAFGRAQIYRPFTLPAVTRR